ncbi:hypothetical protein GCM10010517_28580 [Streptosporangium fragile]|uniref:Uncharacterized protein n=1 Tax=Streptosporangium fragile TaxID=46186 RepID=A0ABP6IC95_9ACTN
MESATEKPGPWSGLALVVLTLIWLIGTPLLFLQVFAEGLRASRGGPSDGDRAMRFLIAAAVVGVTAPALAAIVAGKTRREGAALVFGVAAALCFVAGAVLVSVDLRVSSVPSPEPLPPGYCVERSGGDSDCPGG